MGVAVWDAPWLVGVWVLLALVLDRLLGEPRRWHPLVGFGLLVARLEVHLNRRRDSRLMGLLALLLAVCPWVALAWGLVAYAPWSEWSGLIGALVLYLAIGGRSLGEHAAAVHQALANQDLPLARQRVGYLVSRDAAVLDEAGVSAAACESVLENGCDALFGALFWFVLLGLPGVVLYRLVNTLDAMWGYKTARYRQFGWAAARLDDGLNWIPARLTALTYALWGQTRNALWAWQAQAGQWKSPNAGPVMAAGAGALGVALGGTAQYHGGIETRPPLGRGPAPVPGDILRAVSLIQRGGWSWGVLMLIGGLGLA